MDLRDIRVSYTYS